MSKTAADQIAGRDLTNEAPALQVGVNRGQVAGRDIVNGDLTYIIESPARPRVRVTIQPGPEHVGDAQKARLRELVGEVVRLENAVRRVPKQFGQVWGALTAKLRCTSYHLIPAARYQDAVGFLQTWAARLRSTTSAPERGPDWRNSRYKFIHAAAKQIGRFDDLPGLLAAEYGGRRMRDLTDDELQAVYDTVAAWKQRARRNGAGV